ncbi:MAG: hypothetical protein ACKOTZ_10965 [Chloroflexota bacterium]
MRTRPRTSASGGGLLEGLGINGCGEIEPLVIAAAAARRRRLEAVADAVLVELVPPAVIPIVSSWIWRQRGGSLLVLPNLADQPLVPDPCLGLAVAARRSGAVWIAARPPAVEGMDQVLPLVLLPVAVRDRIVATVSAPDWTERVLARALDLEVTQ